MIEKALFLIASAAIHQPLGAWRAWEGDGGCSASPDTGQHGGGASARARRRERPCAVGEDGEGNLCVCLLMKNRNLRAPLAALPLAILATLSHAQTPTLPATVVTATRVETRTDALLSDVVVIDSAAIEQATGRSLSELLARKAGLQLSSNGGLGKTAGLFIRGTESRHLLLLVDGVRYGSSTAGSPVLDNFPLSLIDRIEVLKGPASGLYGSDAVGVG